MKRPPSCTIVGLVGNHGSGKSTLMNYLSQQVRNLRPDLQVLRLNFADSLRAEFERVLPVRLSQQKQHPYERQALIYLAETWRKQDPDRYVRKYLETLSAIRSLSTHTLVLTDDVYHFNEREVCDHVIYLRNRTYQPPQGYVPESVRQTMAMLEQAERGPLYYTIEHPEDLDYYAQEITNFVLSALPDFFEVRA